MKGNNNMMLLLEIHVVVVVLFEKAYKPIPIAHETVDHLASFFVK